MYLETDDRVSQEENRRRARGDHRLTKWTEGKEPPGSTATRLFPARCERRLVDYCGETEGVVNRAALPTGGVRHTGILECSRKKPQRTSFAQSRCRARRRPRPGRSTRGKLKDPTSRGSSLRGSARGCSLCEIESQMNISNMNSGRISRLRTRMMRRDASPAKRTEMAMLKSVPFMPRSFSRPWTRALASALRSK